MRKWSLLALGSLLAIAAVVHGWLLLDYPAPFVDEAWLAARAWGFVQTGTPVGVLDTGLYGPLPNFWLRFGFVYTAVNAAALWVAGEPSVVAMRIVSLGYGLILLGAVYVIGSRIVSPRVGLVGVALVALSRPFLYSAHLARPDIAAAAFGLVAVALHVANKRRLVWVEVLAAASVGLAFEFHPNGVIYGIAVAVLLVYDEGHGVWRRPHAWGFVGGGVLSIAAYAAAHILPDPATYFSVNRLVYGKSHRPPLLTFDWQLIESAVTGFVSLAASTFSDLGPLVLAACVALVGWRTAQENRLLVLAGTMVAAFVFVVPNKFPYYAIVYSPPLDLVLAAFVVRCADAARDRTAHVRRTAALGVFVLLALALAISLTQLDYRARQGFEAVRTRLPQYIAPGDRIMGSQTYWFFLQEHTYFAWETLPYYKRIAPGSTLADAFAEYRPDVFLVDNQVRRYISAQERNNTYLDELRIPSGELRAFLEARGSRVAEVDSALYGRIEIFRIRWE
jgi:hypothetical protein